MTASRVALRLALVVLAAIVCALAGAPAFAQAKVDLDVSVDADTIEIGDSVNVTLKITTGGEAPAAADLGNIPPSFLQRGISNRMSFAMNGRRVVSMTWQLQSTKTGTYKIGPPSVRFGDRKVTGRPVTVKVVAPGQLPPPKRGAQRPDPFGAPFSLLDPWRGQAPSPEPEDERKPTGEQADPKFGMDAPRGTVTFLHAIADKTTAVVGEQVTVAMYVYIDAAGPDHIEFTDVHEAPASSFLKQPIVPDDAETKPLGYALVGGRLWSVRLARKWALFPLKTGELDIGAMSLTIVKPRVVGDPKRLSESLKIKVGEPPLAGRPPGYQTGDVGSFALAAEVAPREVERGGAVAVTVTLSGTGNLPASLAVPSRKGVEWLEPQVRDAIAPQGDEKVGGKRTFNFVVRMQEEGDFDLGEVKIPFWDPDAKKYGVANAKLGDVKVKPGARPVASADAAQEALAGLPPPRAERSAARAARAHVTDSRWFWLALGASPLAYAAAFGARAASVRIRRRREANAASPARERKLRVKAADDACRGDDARAADAAIARALEAAAIADASVNVRGVRADEVAAKLEAAGVASDAARDVEAILRECEASRFSPDAAGIDAARARWTRARAAIAAMEKA